MINLIDLEKKINSELTTKINKTSIKHDQIYVEIDKDDLISTLENRFISGDVILTGTDIPKDLLLMANQITELRS